EELVTDLQGNGFTVELETWDEQNGKGIDDLLAAGKVPLVLQGADVNKAVVEIVTQAKAVGQVVDGRPARFRNFEEEAAGDGTKPVGHGLPIATIGKSLSALTDGWPRFVYGQLFAEGAEYAPLWIENTDGLFAWIGRHLPQGESNALQWAEGADKVGRGEFF